MSDTKIIAVMGATGAQGGGLARAILADPERRFGVRAITRRPDADKARALKDAGAEIVQGDADDPASLERAFAGAHGVFAVTNFWEHLSPERELKQAAAMARAARAAGVAHVVWSTLEDTRLSFPLDDPRLKTLQGKYKVPHFDAKGEADAIFAAEGAPTSYLMAAFYWENFIYFGQGPRKGADGTFVLALPLAGGKLPGIAAEDIGRCAYGIFRRGPEVAGQRFGIAGDVLSGPEYAAAFTRHLGVPVSFYDMPFDEYRALGFPGAEDMGNMFEHHAILGEEFRRNRSPEVARTLNPALQSFEAWLGENASRIPLG
ncbi:MAG TPA: NmrA/HSCARG family protein [Vicinamibacterales bacterium]